MSIDTIAVMRPLPRLLTHLAATVLVGVLVGCGNEVASKADFVAKMDSISVMKGIKWDCVYDTLKVDHADAIADMMVAEPGALPPGMSALVSPMMATCAGFALPPAAPTTTVLQVLPSEAPTTQAPSPVPSTPAK